MPKRKRIAIFMGEIAGEYQKAVLKAIFKKANDLQYDIFVFDNYGSWGVSPLYAEGGKKILQIPDLTYFDGAIVAMDTLNNEVMENTLDTYLKNCTQCPVVSLRSRSDSFYNILVEDRSSIAAMTRHFLHHHGFKDICFMTGKMEMYDARERYQGFLEAMEEAGIPVTEHMVFKGNYWRNKAKEAIDWYMEDRSTYPQAIICSNDYMALSICEELISRGVRVPEDVCVSGYDDIEECRLNIPSLTSARVPFDSLGIQAVITIDNLLHGRPQSRDTYIQSDLMFRRSCGCAEQINTHDVHQYLIDKLHKQNFTISQTRVLSTAFQASYAELDFLRVAEYYFYDLGYPKAYLCYCPDDEESTETSSDDAAGNMLLKGIFSVNDYSQYVDIPFNGNYLLPESEFDSDTPQNYLFHLLCFENICHGYIVLLFDEKEWPDTYLSSYMSCLSNALENAAVRRQVSNMAEYQRLYLSDALTGLYNRRGFDKHLRDLSYRREHGSQYISIVSIDMDGLKYINDNFGHAEGDAALCTLAEALRSTTLGEGVCARVGGDEFFVLLIADTPDRHQQFEQEFRAVLKECASAANKPYPIDASIGICCIREEKGLSLNACIRKADALMYERKRANKLNRK